MPFGLSTSVFTPLHDGFTFAEMFLATSAVPNSSWIFPRLFLKAWSKSCLGNHLANSLLISMLFASLIWSVVYKENLVFCGVVALKDWSFVSDVSSGHCRESAIFVGLFYKVVYCSSGGFDEKKNRKKVARKNTNL